MKSPSALRETENTLFRLTRHAHNRMTARGLSPQAITVALPHGRTIHTRGAEIHVIGRKEVQRLQERDVNIRDYEGVQVVCDPNGAILTVYRNRDLRGLRPRHRRRRQPRPADHQRLYIIESNGGRHVQ